MRSGKIDKAKKRRRKKRRRKKKREKKERKKREEKRKRDNSRGRGREKRIVKMSNVRSVREVK